MKLSAAIARALSGHGVHTMFGLIGDANMFLAHSFVHDMKRSYVGAAHEAGAMMMGFGYGSLTGRLAVVTVTHGPALTDTVTGLVESVRGRIPMLLVVGDTATHSRTNIQDIAHRDVVLPSGAGFEQARSPESALADLAIAVRRALIERRPVVFNVPADFSSAEVAYDDIALGLPDTQLLHPDPAAVLLAATEIAGAERPVLLAGRGAISAREHLLRLAERIGAPVATTLKAKDLFRGTDFDLGLAGGLAAPVSARILDEADLVISFGAGLNDYTTAKGALLTGRRSVVVDVESRTDAGRTGVTVQGDAGVVAEALIDAVDMLGLTESGFRTPRMAVSLAGQHTLGGRPTTSPGTVDVEVALRYLDEVLPGQRVVVSDGGRFMMESLRHLHVPGPRSFVFPENFGSIGTGMGAAIGAASADSPDPVVLICGDGGFMHGGIGEFNTAVRLGLDLIVVVCNDGGYGAEHVQFLARGLDPAISLFDWPDLADVAEALGGEGLTVREPGDLALIDKAVANRTRPLLIDLRLDVHHITPMPH